MRYALLDSHGVCVNVVLWDGKSQWEPSNDLQIAQIEPALIGRRYQFDKNLDQWIEVSKTQQEIEAEETQRTQLQAEEVRVERNRLLVESDWTQGRDIPDAIAELWATYRQELRDLPQQEGFPWDITWPEPPTN
jgi:hypothetical protein